MEEFDSILRNCPLFSGIAREDIPGLLACLGARTVPLGRGQILFSEGDRASVLGIVLAGALQLIREDYDGNRSMVTHVPPAGVFGESYACAGVDALPVSVVAEEDSTVLLVDCHRIVVTCSNACSFHTRLLSNLLGLVAKKNLELNRKMHILSRRTTREKLMAYLRSESKLRDSRVFTIPYDRQGLADYLEVDRSGLSVEIGKLRKAGIIECEKSTFRLL